MAILKRRAETLPSLSVFAREMARRTLADAMALDLDDNGLPTSTATLTGLEASKMGYKTLTLWARQRSISVTYDEPTATASFSYAGKQIKLHLASNKAVVNGQEVALGGKFILARGEKWFVPAEELVDAIG